MYRPIKRILCNVKHGKNKSIAIGWAWERGGIISVSMLYLSYSCVWLMAVLVSPLSFFSLATVLGVK